MLDFEAVNQGCWRDAGDQSTKQLIEGRTRNEPE